MKLGFMVTRDNFKAELSGLAESALAKGHEVIIFLTDDGVNLILQDEIAKLKDCPGITMSLCDHSAKLRGIGSDKIPEGITAGSQYQNAAMNQDADKVIVI